MIYWSCGIFHQMLEPIPIIEISERAITGVSSRPFRCLGEDGHAYYVKLGNALAEERVLEWLFGHLAAEMGLPTPGVRLVSIAESLSRESAWDTQEFGCGIGFGSCEIPNSVDLRPEHLAQVPEKLQADTLCFDWWIQNEDRKMGPFGGNPNILFSIPNPSELLHPEFHLIDHGNAMDSSFNREDFWKEHAFASAKQRWEDETRRSEWISTAESAIGRLETDWNDLPENWFVESGLQIGEVSKLLEAPWNDDTFWTSFES